MSDFYYYCGNPAELRATSTKYLFAQFVNDREKLLYIVADNLERIEPYGWSEFVLYNVDPSFLTFCTLKGNNLVSLRPYNNLIENDLNWWSARDTQLIAPFASHRTTLQLAGTPTIVDKITQAKTHRSNDIRRTIMNSLSKTMRQNSA